MSKRFCLRFPFIFVSFGLLSACAGQTDVSYAPQPPEQALQGATPGVLTAAFGPPMLRRVDGPAQVWLYQTPSCDLNVFLYPGPDGMPHVTQLLPDNGVKLPDCLQELARPTTAAALARSATS